MKKIVFTILFILLASCPIVANAKASNKPSENFANIVFFAYYDGTTTQIEEDKKYYEDNSSFLIDLYEGTSKRSFTNYLKEISYGKFNVKNIFPQLENGSIKPMKLNINIQDSYDRNNDSTLIQQIVATYPSISSQIVDYNNDGYIDNLTIIIKDRDGYTATNHSTFVSHKGDYPEAKKYLNKYIGTYNIVNTASIVNPASIINNESGVITHEFLHSLGFPDLYRSDASSVDYPVDVCDIMASANQGMSYPLAYLRKEFTKWLDIETITQSTSLRLDLQSNADGNQAFILKSPLNDYEYFVVEYRKKDFGIDNLDRHIGGSGIIVYRVDTTVEGLSNHYGKTGVYVFRPQNDVTLTDEKQKVYNAYLSQESGRTSIGSANMNLGLKDGALTFSDGGNSGIVIKNVSKTNGAYMTLDVEIPKAENFDLWQNKNLPDLIGGNANTNKNIAITKYKDKLFALSYANNKVYTQSLENNKWVTKGTSNITLDAFTNIKVVELNNTLYLIANNTNALNVYKWNDGNNTWSYVSSYQETLNEFEVSNIDNKLYIAGSTSNKATLYVLNSNTLTKLGDYYSGINGIPKIGEINHKIYVSIKNMNGDILLYQYNANQFNPIHTGINANNYDLKSLDNKLYIALGTDLNGAKLLLNEYDGSRWETISSSLALSFPNLVVSQGNLYIIGTSNNNLYTYSYQEDTKKFTMEGTIVDTGSSFYDTSLVAIANSIYVGIKKANNTLLVKAKETTNRLISLSVTPPTKVTYEMGESLDKTGLRVIANYTNGQKEVTNYTISNFNTNTIGTHSATITYEGISNTFTYQVVNTSINLPTIKDGIYAIHSAINPKFVLDINGASKDNGANVHLYENSVDGQKRFKVTYLGDGYYNIIAMHSNKSLDVKDASQGKGANVWQWEANGSDSQKWIIKDVGNGYYSIISKCNGLYIDVNNGIAGNFTNIQMCDGNGLNAQKFIFEKVRDKNDTPIQGTKTLADGTYIIRSSINPIFALDVYGASNTNGANVQLYEYTIDKQKKFKVTYLGDGCYSLVALHSNKSLAVKDSSFEKGANVHQWEQDGSDSQKWIIKSTGDGYYSIISKLSGFYIDVNNGIANNYTNLQMCNGNGMAAQKFRFDRVKENSEIQVQGAKTLDTGTYIIRSSINPIFALDVNRCFYCKWSKCTII